MAKKEKQKAAEKKAAKKQKNKAQAAPEVEGALPQNILPVGERVQGDKNIYIAQKVYRKIHQFTEGKTENESGGILVGEFVEEFGKQNILIEGFIEAKHCEATPQTLTFTHETWEAVDKEMEKKHKGKSIVGWIHTHPDFGIFLSNYDTFIQENFFKEENQIAYVIDPIRGEEGFYFWEEGKIERCPGFYLYDKTGVPIKALKAEQEEAPAEPEKGGGVLAGIQTALLVVLSAVVVMLGFQVISLNEQVNLLSASVGGLLDEARLSFAVIAQEQRGMDARISAIEDMLGIAPQAPSPEASAALPEPSIDAQSASPETSPAASQPAPSQEDTNG